MSILTRTRFATDEKGSVLMIFGLVFLILVWIGGAGYDLGHQQLIRQKLQQATDAASLAAGGMGYGSSNAARETTANRYYRLNFPDGYLGVSPVPDATVQVGTTTVQVTSDTNAVPTSFVRNLPGGPTSLPAKGDSTAALRINAIPPIDMILVMDNSSSMALLDVGSGSTQNVPPADIGTARSNGIAACIASQNNAATLASYISQFSAFLQASPYYYTVAAANAYATSYYTPAVFLATITSTCNSLLNWDNSLCPYGTGNCAPNYGLTGVSGGPGPNRLNALRYSTNYIADKLLAPPNDTIGNRIGIARFSDVLLESEPLSTNLSQVSGYLNKMFAYGQTNSTTGLEAAVATSTSMNPTSARSVVLLTDGVNDNASYNASSLTQCATLKTKGIIVYTIAFGQEVVNNTAVKNFLSACASGTAGSNQDLYFFVAPDAATLEATFKNIIISLQRVRVTQ